MTTINFNNLTEVRFNNTDVTKVVFNNTTVWEKQAADVEKTLFDGQLVFNKTGSQTLSNSYGVQYLDQRAQTYNLFPNAKSYKITFMQVINNKGLSATQQTKTVVAGRNNVFLGSTNVHPSTPMELYVSTTVVGSLSFMCYWVQSKTQDICTYLVKEIVVVQ